MYAALLLLALIGQSAPDESPVILDFGASWCAPCKAMAPAIDSLIKSGYPVRKVDIDASSREADRYHIEAVPTLVLVDSAGKEIGRSSSLRTPKAIGAWYNGHVAKRNAAIDAAATENHSADANKAVDMTVNPSPWKTVVRITVLNTRSVGYGSGTVIHSTDDTALVLTCAHLFADRKKQLIAGQKFDLPVNVEFFDGEPKGKPLHVSPTRKAVGTVVDVHFGRDVALVSVPVGHSIPFSRITPPEWTPTVGDHMRLVSCGEGKDPTMVATEITRTTTGSIPSNPGYIGFECRLTPKQGRSGGGLFTDDGYVAGVTDFAEPQGNHGLYAHPKSIRAILAHAGMTDLYRDDDTKIAAVTPNVIAEASASEIDETTFSRLFQKLCKKNPPAPGKDGRDGIDGKPGINGLNGKDGRNGADGKDGTGTPFDPTAMLARITALEQEAAKNITVAIKTPTGEIAKGEIKQAADSTGKTGIGIGFPQRSIGIDLSKFAVPVPPAPK